MSVKLFYKQGCKNCPQAKALCQKLEKDGAKVLYYDVDTVDGLAEASFHEVMATPTIVVVNSKDTELKSWRGTTPTAEEIKKVLKEK
ncbi:MAG: thioredoxin family protein [Thermoplasmata archaeon]